MRVLIDTDIFIDILREYPPSLKILKGIINGKIIGYFSVISEAELLSGKECKQTEKRKAVIELLSLCTKIKIDNKIAEIAGKLRRNFGVNLDDGFIAATAISSKLPLMTRNVKDFKKLPLKVIKPYE